MSLLKCCPTCGEPYSRDDVKFGHQCCHGGPAFSLQSISDESQYDIGAIMYEHGFAPLRQIEPLSRIQLAITIAKTANDNRFSKGKWATIQAMEQIIAENLTYKTDSLLTSVRRDVADAATGYSILSGVLEKGDSSNQAETAKISALVDEAETRMFEQVEKLNIVLHELWLTQRAQFVVVHGEDAAVKAFGVVREPLSIRSE